MYSGLSSRGPGSKSRPEHQDFLKKIASEKIEIPQRGKWNARKFWIPGLGFVSVLERVVADCQA